MTTDAGSGAAATTTQAATTGGTSTVQGGNVNAGAQTTTTTQTVKPTGDWTSGYSDEMRGYIQAKGFKDHGAIADSYKNLEKLVGAGLDKIIKLPEKSDAPEWNDIYTKLGKPFEAKNYKIPMPEGMTENKPLTDAMRNAFHEANLTSDQAEKVVNKWNELTLGKAKEVNEAKVAANKKAVADLETEWGKAFGPNVEVAKKAAKAFGLDGDKIEKLEQALGFPDTMKFLKDIGSKIAVEGQFVGGANQPGFGGAMEPAMAQAKIKELMGDQEFVRRIASGDQKTTAEWNKLHEYAFPGTRESVYMGPPGRR